MDKRKKLQLTFLLLLIGTVTAFSAPLFFGLQSAALGGGGGSSVTVDSDWGTTNASTATVVGPTRNITTPGGAAKSIRFNVSGAADTTKFSIAGGGFGTFTNGQTTVTSTGDTLAFEIIGATSGDTVTITVTDVATSTSVGTCILHRN